MMATGLVYDRRYMEHRTGAHPENPQRLQSIVSHLQITGLLQTLQVIAPCAIDEDVLNAAHTPEMVAQVKDLCSSGGGPIGFDTVASPESYEIARLAVGGVMEGIDRVIRGELDNAMALVRPPGHHATRNRSMGFCLFNNVALGALHLLRNHELERVLIVDWDLHHGNGTQDFFYDSPNVFYYSIHQGNHYPGTGGEDEVGGGAGRGWTLNRPLAPGTDEKEFLNAFQKDLEVAVRVSRPEFILLSAGFDAHRDDPLGSLMLTEAGYAELTRLVLSSSAEHAGGRLVSALEGGYHPDALARSVAAHLEVMVRHG
jgi:acetoin utilization deacetylase AcuC-like enzyme